MSELLLDFIFLTDLTRKSLSKIFRNVHMLGLSYRINLRDAHRRSSRDVHRLVLRPRGVYRG